jgi:hypothetical protein
MSPEMLGDLLREIYEQTYIRWRLRLQPVPDCTVYTF